MVNRASYFKLIIGASLFAAASPVFGLTCGEKSPLFEQLGDDYFNTDIVPPKDSATPEINTNQLFDALDTYSLETGQGEHTLCTVHDTETVPVSVAITVEEIEIETRLGEVLINALEVHPDDTNNHRVKIALSVKSEHVNVVNDNRLEEVIRQRRTSSTGSHFEETRLALRRIDTGIAVERLRYVNGELAEWLRWTLSP